MAGRKILFAGFLGGKVALKLAQGWTKPGAHVLLQSRAHVLNDELRSKFQKWYPGMKAA